MPAFETDIGWVNVRLGMFHNGAYPLPFSRTETRWRGLLVRRILVLLRGLMPRRSLVVVRGLMLRRGLVLSRSLMLRRSLVVVRGLVLLRVNYGRSLTIAVVDLGPSVANDPLNYMVELRMVVLSPGGT